VTHSTTAAAVATCGAKIIVMPLTLTFLPVLQRNASSHKLIKDIKCGHLPKWYIIPSILPPSCWTAGYLSFISKAANQTVHAHSNQKLCFITAHWEPDFLSRWFGTRSRISCVIRPSSLNVLAQDYSKHISLLDIRDMIVLQVSPSHRIVQLQINAYLLTLSNAVTCSSLNVNSLWSDINCR